MNNTATATKTSHITLPPLLRGAVAAAICAIIGSAVLSAAFCFTNLSASTMHALQLPLLGVSAFIGAFVAARTAGRKGLRQGLKMTALLLIIMLAFTISGSIFSPVAFVLKGLIVLIACALGGILGVF